MSETGGSLAAPPGWMPTFDVGAGGIRFIGRGPVASWGRAAMAPEQRTRGARKRTLRRLP